MDSLGTVDVAAAAVSRFQPLRMKEMVIQRRDDQWYLKAWLEPFDVKTMIGLQRYASVPSLSQ